MWFCQTLTLSLQVSVLGRVNKLQYSNYMQRRKVLNRCRIDAVWSFLHQAIMCYSMGKYNETLKLVKHSKDKISSMRPLNAINTITVEYITQAGGEDLPIETVLKESFLDYVWICDDKCIPEFYIEMHGHAGNFKAFNTRIPPSACALFLQFLCYEKLCLKSERDETLQELCHFVMRNHLQDEQDKTDCAISWQIRRYWVSVSRYRAMARQRVVPTSWLCSILSFTKKWPHASDLELYWLNTSDTSFSLKLACYKNN